MALLVSHESHPALCWSVAPSVNPYLTSKIYILTNYNEQTFKRAEDKSTEMYTNAIITVINHNFCLFF